MKSSWLLDSGASHHVTSNLGNHSLHSPYDGLGDIMTIDGTGLSITHTGSKTLSSPSNSFKSNNILCVPSMQRNLISISKFFHQKNSSIEFSPSSFFFLKDLTMGTTLLQG